VPVNAHFLIPTEVEIHQLHGVQSSTFSDSP